MAIDAGDSSRGAPSSGDQIVPGAGPRGKRDGAAGDLPGSEETLPAVSATDQTMAVDEASAATLPPSDSGSESAQAPVGWHGKTLKLKSDTGPGTTPVRDARTTGETVPGTLGGAGDLPDLPAVDPAHYARGFEIARGGMGRVVVARDRRLGRTIAIKELISNDRGLEQRFEREVRITARLQHPSIITVHEAGRWPTGEPFYAMKRVEGRALDRVIADKTSYAERLALLPNVIAVADALAYAHDQRVIHRDLKPANVLLGPFGETVVIDWGLAKDLDVRSEVSLREAEPSVRGGEAETRVGSVLGTPSYMPPEQARGEAVDERTDVYALGAILYTVLVGRPPYAGDQGSDVLAAVLRGPPAPITRSVPEVAPDLAAIVDQAMARDPGDRYRNAGELVEDLRRFATGQLVSVHQYSMSTLVKRWIGRHRAAVSVAAVAAVVMGVLGTLAITRIVDKERVARAQKEIAERQSAVAESNQSLAEQRADRITLLQARSALDRDPTEALAWLKQVPIRDDTIAEIRTIAQRAVARGVAEDVLRTTSQIEAVAVAPDEHMVAIGWSGGRVLLRDRKAGTTNFLTGVGSFVVDVEFSSDGQHLAAVAEDGTVMMWRLPANEAKVLGKHRGLGLQVAFSRDDRWLASAGATPEVLVWDLESGAGRSLRSGDLGVTWLEFAPSGDRLASAGADGSVRLWDVAAGTSRIVATQLGSVARVAFSPDGTQLASASLDDGVRIWPLSGGAGRRLEGGRSNMINVVFSPTGTALVAAEKGGTLRYWDLATHHSRSLIGHSGEPTGLLFEATADRVVSAAMDGTVRVWDVTTGDCQLLLGHAPIIVALAQSPHGLVISSDTRGSARTWQVPPRSSRLIGKHESPVFTLAISPDGGKVAFAGERNSVQIVDLVSGETRALIGHEGPVWDVAYSPDGRRLASVGSDRTARLWDLQSGRSELVYRHSSALSKVAFSAGGAHLAFRGVEDVILLWSTKSRAVRVLGDEEHLLTGIWFAPRGEVLASPLSSGEIVLFDLTDGTETLLRGHSAGAIGIGFSPNGKALASCDTSERAILWDLQTGVGRTLDSPCRSQFIPTFSPDGSRVAYAAPDQSLIVENVRSREQQRLVGHQERVYRLEFFRDSSTLVSTSADRTIRVWNLDSGMSHVLVGHHRGAYRAIGAQNDSMLVSSGLDGDVRLWEDPLEDRLPTSPSELKQWLEVTTSAEVSPNAGAESQFAKQAARESNASR